MREYTAGGAHSSACSAGANEGSMLDRPDARSSRRRRIAYRAPAPGEATGRTFFRAMFGARRLAVKRQASGRVTAPRYSQCLPTRATRAPPACHSA